MEHVLVEAHRYAAEGLHVIPIRERDKRPAIRTGPEHSKMATTSYGVIEAWWNTHPEWNIAIVCTASRLVVIDVDGPIGEETLARLVKEHGPLPPTWEAKTGNGRHLFYRWPDGIRVPTTVAGPKLDIRGAGSYVVAPPSIHPSGRIYEWVTTGEPIPTAPEWVCQTRTFNASPIMRRPRRPHVDEQATLATSEYVADLWESVHRELLRRGNTAAAEAVDAVR